VMTRLAGAVSVVPVGHPSESATLVGPLIDADAQQRVRAYVAAAPDQGTVLLERDDLPTDGYFAPPTIVTNVPVDASLATDEIFGPVLAVFRAGDFDEAIRIANATPY